MGVDRPAESGPNGIGQIDFTLSRPKVTRELILVVLVLFVLIGLVALSVGSTVRKRRKVGWALLAVIVAYLVVVMTWVRS